MSVTSFSPGDLESRAWRSVFQDGLWDIALGTTFLGIGLAATLDLARGWPMLAGSAVVLAIGIGSLAWFLKFYPKPTLEAANANS